MKQALSILVIALSIILFSCNSAQSDAAKKPMQTQPAVKENTQGESATVKILKEGIVVAEYSAYIPGAVRMPEEGGKESMIIYLHSEDNKYVLSGSFKQAVSGTYAIGGKGNNGVGLDMSIDGTTASPQEIKLDKGDLKITLDSKTCSGTFSGTGNMNGKNYEISGTFTNIPLR